MPEFRCNKCGAQVKFEAGDRFVKCSYCGTQLFIDKSGAGFFYIMPFLVDRTNSQGIFRRWAAGARMAKDLDKLANIVEHKQAYFPVYLFRRDVNGKEARPRRAGEVDHAAGPARPQGAGRRPQGLRPDLPGGERHGNDQSRHRHGRLSPGPRRQAAGAGAGVFPDLDHHSTSSKGKSTTPSSTARAARCTPATTRRGAPHPTF